MQTCESGAGMKETGSKYSPGISRQEETDMKRVPVIAMTVRLMIHNTVG